MLTFFYVYKNMLNKVKNKTIFKFLIDLLLWSMAAPIAFLLRLENPWPRYIGTALTYTLIGLPVKALLEMRFALHLQSWRRASMRDLYTLIKAIFLGAVLLSASAFFLHFGSAIPRSVPIIEGGLALLLLGGIRLAGRMMSERSQLARLRSSGSSSKRVLIVGAGEAGTMLAREMLRHPESKLVPIGFLDDDPNKQRQKFVGLPVLGRIDDLPQIASDMHADEVLIAIPSAPGKVVRKVVELARRSELRYRIVPGIYEILSGKVTISTIRDVDVEDLLRRDPVKLDTSEIAKYINNRIILITGAGGSIGSEIVRQVARFGPRRILLLGRGENSLYQIERELERTWPELDWRTIVADVRDREKMKYVFTTFSPEVVFHSAAHKHVPMMEANPDEAIFNNVGGTKNVVELALEHGVSHFVNISTDKAVNPTSVMGASKRIAEYLVLDAAEKADSNKAFVSVRFGNVLGSRGSVIPLFKDQIARGGPVTVTHRDMKRYFMTIPEAAQLVLQAGALGNNGAVYVLDMGEPIRIADLAQDLIRLSGLEPGVDIDIVYTGVRPGEKLFEELLTAEEGTFASKHSQIYVAKISTNPLKGRSDVLDELFKAASSRKPEKIREVLKLLIPSYTPTIVS